MNEIHIIFSSTITNGVVSSSGWGDGLYKLYTLNDKDNVVGLKIIFIEEKECGCYEEELDENRRCKKCENIPSNTKPGLLLFASKKKRASRNPNKNEPHTLHKLLSNQEFGIVTQMKDDKNTYFEKYIKYKTKYLDLKNKLS
jgi:hypothetical protein